MKAYHPLIILAYMFVSACSRTTNNSTTPLATAYTDGFEVIVTEFSDDATILSAKSLPLKAAESIVSGNSRCSYAIHDTEQIVEFLKANESRQGDFTIHIDLIEQGSDQKVRTTFQYGSKSFWYEYSVADRNVTPLSSGFRDLNQDSVVQYVEDSP
jgi:hypothetical protein